MAVAAFAVDASRREQLPSFSCNGIFCPVARGGFNDEPAQARLAAGAACNASAIPCVWLGCSTCRRSRFSAHARLHALLVALHFADCRGRAFAVRTLASTSALTAHNPVLRDAAEIFSVYHLRARPSMTPSALAARIARSHGPSTSGCRPGTNHGEFAQEPKARFWACVSPASLRAQARAAARPAARPALVWLFLLMRTPEHQLRPSLPRASLHRAPIRSAHPVSG